MNKKTALLLALLSFAMGNAQWERKKIEGDGNKTSITRTTSDYDEITVGGPFNVELVSGKEGIITINADENLLEYIKTEVDGSKLKIYIDNGVSIKYGSKNISITIPFEKIHEVSYAGSGNFITKNSVDTENLILKFSGSGNGIFDVKCSKITIALAGSGDLKVSGSTNSLEAKVAGSGDLDSSKLESQNAEVSVAGSGNLKVNCIKKLTAMVAGSGSIHYKGKPESIDKNIVGSGDIKNY